MNKKITWGISLLLVATLIISAAPAIATILPHETYGTAQIDAGNAPDGYTVTTWIDGTEYEANEVFNDDGSYQVFTPGDDPSNEDFKSGGVNGDTIVYRIEDDVGNVYIADQNVVFDDGTSEEMDIDFQTAGQPSIEVKINEIVPQPGDAGTQYVYLYDTVGITLEDWRLENHDGFSASLDTLDTEYHQEDADLLYVDLGASDIIDTAGDALMLSWNPGATGINQGDWVVMDRVEFGSIVAPENTIHEEFPTAPDVGECIVREVNGQDTDNSAEDFIIEDETGRPVTWDPEPVTGIWVEKDELAGDLILHWDDIEAPEYNIYYSDDKHAAMPWTVIDTVSDNEFTDVGALGGENYYYVTATDGAEEGEPSEIAFCYEMLLTFDAGAQLHYVSIPNRFNNMETITASDIVMHIEGGTGVDHNEFIDEVVKWDYTERTFTEAYSHGGFGWGGDDFVVEPNAAVGLRLTSNLNWNINGTEVEEQISLTFDAGAQLHYITIPYTIEDIVTASDIVMAIEGGTGVDHNEFIDEVVKWDYTERTFTEAYSHGGFGWGGDDFVVEPGATVGLRLTNNLDWTPGLITP